MTRFAGQLVASATLLPLIASSVLAQAPPLEDRLVQCWQIEKPDDRLACFDREAAPLARARAARSTAATAPPVAAPAPPEAAPQDAQIVHARITELRRSGMASYQVLLDNGQSWQHENEYLGQYLQKGEAVTITRAAMGNYRLTRDAGKSKDWIRVTRVR